MKKSLIGIIFIIGMGIFLPAILQAQDSTLQNLPAQWSLQDCIQYAVQHNIDLNTLRLDARSGEQDLLQSKAARLPGVSGSVSQSLVNSKNTNPVVGGFQTQANFSSSYGVSSSLTLYNGGYLKNDIKAKNLSLQSANLNVEQAANDITLNITQAFLNILLTRENIVYLEDLVTTSKAQLKQGQQRFDAGSISRKDLLQLQAQEASDEYSLVSAQNTLRSNTLTLKQILQLPTSFSFQVAIPDTVPVQEEALALPEAQQAAEQTRPEVKNGELGIKLAQVDLAKAKAGALPTVSLGAGLSTGYSDNQSSKYFSQLNNNFYQQIGVTVGIPIFSKRTNKTNVEKSKIAIEQARLSLQGTKTTLDQEVEQAYLNLENARAQYDAAAVQLKASEESYRITNEQFRIGSVNLVDLLQQKNLYLQALQDYTQAKYSAVLNNKIYDFYTGVPVSL